MSVRPVEITNEKEVNYKIVYQPERPCSYRIHRKVGINFWGKVLWKEFDYEVSLDQAERAIERDKINRAASGITRYYI